MFLGLYFVVSGAFRLGLGTFGRGMRAGSRVLNIILGVLLILVGIVALRNVSSASVALVIFAVTFIGVGWIIEGVMALAEAGRRHKHSGWSIAFGVLSVLSGVIVLLLPATSAVVLIIYAAVALVVLGILGVVRAVTFGRGSVKTTPSPTAQ